MSWPSFVAYTCTGTIFFYQQQNPFIFACCSGQLDLMGFADVFFRCLSCAFGTTTSGKGGMIHQNLGFFHQKLGFFSHNHGGGKQGPY